MLEQETRDAQDHPALSWVARLGFATYGVVYIVVGVLAGQLAVGDSSGKVSGQGALHELAQQSWGEAFLVLATLGLAGLALWKVTEAFGGHTDQDGASRAAARAGSVGRAVILGGLAFLCAQVVLGESSGGGGTDGYTAKLMDLPFGPWLVGAVGLGVAAYGIVSAYKGLSDGWKKDLDHGARAGNTGTALAVLARVGFTGRGAAFVLIGGLFVWAGVTHDARKSAGLDQALRELRDAPFGPVLLGGIAVGLAAYGLFNAAKAWALRD